MPLHVAQIELQPRHCIKVISGKAKRGTKDRVACLQPLTVDARSVVSQGGLQIAKICVCKGRQR